MSTTNNSQNVTIPKEVTSTAIHRMWTNLQEIFAKMKPKSTEYTLNHSKWTGTSAPYKYELTLTGVTATDVVVVNLANSLTDDNYDIQYIANLDADIRRVKQSADTLTFYAYGDKPLVDLTYDIAVL